MTRQSPYLLIACILLSGCENRPYPTGVMQYYEMGDKSGFYTPNYEEDYFPSSFIDNNAYSVSHAVHIKDSYHIGQFRSPQSHQSVDAEWVNTQPSQQYTIELISDDNRATVANRLLKTPKNERTAQIPVSVGGKVVYKGVYGTFKNQEDAEKALQMLPDAIKNRAKITPWHQLQ